jgi:hypothetical protein
VAGFSPSPQILAVQQQLAVFHSKETANKLLISKIHKI